MPIHSRSVAASAVATALILVISMSPRHAQYASASDSGQLAVSAVRSASEFNWKQSPSPALGTAGRNSVSLNSCPPGVIATEPAYYVYLSGSGTPEAVRVTGGTCKGDSHSGTLEFTTVNLHPSGYVVGSASGGIQEASIAARFIPTPPRPLGQSGRVTVSPGEYDVHAPISIRSSNQTIDFSGAILNCYTANDACIFVGDPGSSNAFESITLVGPSGRPMVVGSTKPFIEVNGNQTRILNVSSRWPPQGGTFGSYVQVDDDQAFLLDGLDTTLGGSAVTCNPSYCGAFITAPGPFNKWSAVGWLKNLNISLQCAGKGVEWLSGNGLKISDSVIQGWSVFGIRVSNQRGGYAGLITDNVYFEASPSCKEHSPYGNVGSAAVVAEGIQVKMNGLAANSANGVFPNWGIASGNHDYLYWVVPVSDKFGDGVPLPAGHALSNGSGTIIGTFPRIAGAAGYKILKRDWDGRTPPRPYPQGTGIYLLTTIQQSSCATLTCSFTDNGGALTSYANVGENPSANIYMPRLDFWPGAIVLSPAEDMSSERYSVPSLPLMADVLGAGAVVTTQPAWAVAGEANTIMGSAATPTAAANLQAVHTNGFGPFPGATILMASSRPQQALSGYKGRLNFGQRGAGGFTPIITLGDSNWGKTWSTSGNRPPADVNDLDLGYEGNIDTFYTRAQNEVREYVGKFPDGNPQEKLSATTKTFNVPVTINGNLTVTGKCMGCGGGSSSASSSNAPALGSVSLASQKAGINAANLCAAAACGPGQYRISYYLDSASACASPGNASATLTLGWKDETAARNLRVPLAGNGVTGGNAVALGQPANFGTGSVLVWSAGNSPITYSTAFADCASGTGSYSVRIAVEKLQ